jgi:hypothetical protein
MQTTLHPRVEAAIRTTRLRGRTMAEQGYTYEPVDRTGRVWFCRRPQPAILPDGTIVVGYHIDAHDNLCECLMHERGGVCKHLLGLRRHIEDALVAATALKAMATRWVVVEVDPVLGDLPGQEFGTREEAEAWVSWEMSGAALYDAPPARLEIREVSK